MHFRAVLVCALFMFTGAFFCTSAEPDNGKFLPTAEPFVTNHIYFELGGGLNLPLKFYTQGNVAMTDYGTNFFAGAGYNLSGWLLGLEFTHDQWGEGKGSYALMKNFKNNITEVRIRKIISKKTWDWLPFWLEIVPGLGSGINFITTDYYPSRHAKETGRVKSISLFSEGASCLVYDASLEFTANFGTDMLIPFAGIDYNAFYDTSIGGGIAGFGRVYLGLRAYPLGAVNDIKRLREKRKNKKVVVTEPMPEVTPEPEPIPEVPVQAPVEEVLPPELAILISPQQDFTPDGDGIFDTANIRPQLSHVTEPVSSWKVEILDPQKHTFKTWSGTGNLPDSISWDGTSDNGELVFSRNVYTVQVSVTLSEKDAALAGTSVVTASSQITAGILMIEIIPDKQWKIIVNTIHFDPDRATFNKISPEQQKENNDTLDSIVRQIKQHGSVSILVEGYANNVTNTAREDREELIPLSTLRADTILELLVERGLNQSAISATGRGGANPIAAWKDHDNWWKNRRVEFIVTKGDNEQLRKSSSVENKEIK